MALFSNFDSFQKFTPTCARLINSSLIDMLAGINNKTAFFLLKGIV